MYSVKNGKHETGSSKIGTESEGKKPSFKLSIALYESLCFFFITCVIMFIGFQEINNIATIGSSVDTIHKEKLPEFVENQKTLTNIESLRRLAEVTNISDNSRERRGARISADALIAESIFDSDPGFRNSASKIAAAMKVLVTTKDEVDKQKQAIAVLEPLYYSSIAQMARLVENEEDLAYLLKININSFIQDPFKSNLTINELKAQTGESIGRVTSIAESIVKKNPTRKEIVESYLKNIENALNKRLSILESAFQKKAQAQEIWQRIDADLRVMRDSVTKVSEASIAMALQEIKDTSENSLRYSIVLYLMIVGFFVIYYILSYFLIIKPLRRTSDKLTEIQAGELNTELPHIHIKEISHVAELLDRFSAHLSELYSHANQLEEDVAKKRNLEEIMRAVFKVSLDGYIVWNADHVISVSEGAMNFLQLDSEEKVLDHWVAQTTLAQRADEVFAKTHDMTAWREEVALTIQENIVLPCEVTHLLINFNDEQCILSYIRDLREQKKNEIALLAAKEQAEVATQAKSEFLARMSHEIRTPMNGVIGLTQIALESSPSPRQQELLTKIQASARILLGVINDILDFSKLEQGKMQLEKHPFSLIEVFVTITDMLETQAEKKNTVFERHIDNALFEKTRLLGDSLRLSQVLLNLCGNAIKFTEKGRVTLSVTSTTSSDEEMSLSFSIKDTGIGMSESQLQLIFQPFSQADGSTTRKYGGTGLGLIISKFLVEQMGGKISVQSQLGVGSEFSFTITLPVVHETPIVTNETENSAAEHSSVSLKGKRILVAEDNDINQEIIVAFLEDFGITVTVANNGQEALDILQHHDFDCIFMDIQMPVMDGLTAAKTIRAHGRPEIRNIPIIAMTAHVMREDIQKSMDVGMNAHLTKPIDYVQFVACLEKYLGQPTHD